MVLPLVGEYVAAFFLNPHYLCSEGFFMPCIWIEKSKVLHQLLDFPFMRIYVVILFVKNLVTFVL